jgi:hypothetical protein
MFFMRTGISVKGFVFKCGCCFGGGVQNKSGKVVVKQETALPCTRLNESEELTH